MEFTHSELYTYLFLPLMIFFARIADVTVGTLRIIFVSKGMKYLSPVLGFFEVIIWLMAATQIFENVDNWVCYIAYGGGFATGVFVGMVIEEKIALGVELIRIITQKDASDLIKTLKEKGYGLTYFSATGSQGEVGIIYSIIRRSDLKEFVAFMQKFNPNAFYTIEDIRFVNKDVFRPLNKNLMKRKMVGENEKMD